jgi:hypothetical protein
MLLGYPMQSSSAGEEGVSLVGNGKRLFLFSMYTHSDHV